VLSALAKLPWQVVSVRLLSPLPDVSVTGTAAAPGVATATQPPSVNFYPFCHVTWRINIAK
jgi:hypothetical protein